MTRLDAIDAGLPVAIIGAGPIGLAAAAHLAARGLPFVVLESGREAGAAVREWGHVRVFSPWRYNIDAAARRLLTAVGWRAPADDGLPTGHEIVDRYLAPLAGLDAIRPHVRVGAAVRAVGRKDFDKVQTEGRAAQPFELRLADGSAVEARAVIDASGTWRTPNPIGAGGVPAEGEAACAGRIAYGIPDVLGAARERYAGRRTLVVGGGHSAMNVILDLLALHDEAPGGAVVWALRRDRLDALFGGGDADALPARGALGARVKAAVAAGRLEIVMPFRIREARATGDGIDVIGRADDAQARIRVDRIIGATGFRPDLDMLREVRLDLDPWLEAPTRLAPMIDPNLHSCGTVPPHGARELAQPEQDFFVVGMKSYGRAPTFLMATGYEQVRSVAAWLAGDRAAAEQTALALPETGVCSGPTESDGGCCAPSPVSAASACCGGPAPAGVEACCADDAAAKAAGAAGCGCGPAVRASG